MATASAYCGHDDTFDRNRRLRRMAAVAALMDTAITIPFTRLRFGADAVLGLAPGLGDLAGAAISVVLVNEARRLGIPNEKLLGMLLNVGIDTFGGSVPILGDLFDAYFKANRRNVDIVLDHFGMTRDDLARTRF